MDSWLDLNDLQIPMLPDMASRVIALAAEPDVSVAKLSHIISKDPVLTTRILGFANSAYCSPANEITSLTQAVVMMGVAAVRNIVLSVSFASQRYEARVYGPHGRRFFDHAIGTAYAARMVAGCVGASADEAFLGGLLHDVGKLVILKQAHHHRMKTGMSIREDELQSTIDGLHTVVGGITVEHWKLPAGLYELVLCHHDYRQATNNISMAAVVYLANRLSHRYGLGCDAHEDDLLSNPACAELDITADSLSDFDAHIPGLFEVARRAVA